jgi:hypothetical protein
MSDSGRKNTDGWERITRLVIAAARRAGLDRDDAEDCAVEYELALATVDHDPPDIRSPTVAERVKMEIWWHIKTCLRRRDRALRVKVSLDEPAVAAGIGLKAASPETGPEELALWRLQFEAVLCVIGSISAARIRLWRRVELDGAKVVDLARETGRSADSLYKELSRTRKQIRDRLAAMDLLNSDIGI